MSFESYAYVTKISTSDMVKSMEFYEAVLNCKVDERWTLNSGGNFGPNSYVQLEYFFDDRLIFTLGLYKDIDKPYNPPPQTGSVPSFVVNDIKATLKNFKALGVHIDQIDGQEIIINKSDQGYVDHFFFFRDLDNNSLVVRQNFGKEG